MMVVLSVKEELYYIYNFWSSFFSLKEEDDEELPEFITGKFNYNNGKLKVE